jgi:hypothetical protein
MRIYFQLSRGVALACAISSAATIFPRNSPAQSFSAADYATNAAYADGWQEGDNGGFGFAPWSMAGTTGSPTQWTMDSTSPFNQLGTAWTLFNPLSSDLVKVTRPLATPLQVGQVLAIVFDNPPVVRMYHGFGVGLLSGATERLSAWHYGWPYWSPGAGGNPYGLWQMGTDAHLTSLYASNTSQGVRLEVQLTGANAYSLTMTPLDHPELAYSTNGPLANSGAINQVQFLFYDDASDPAEPTDFYISRITITSAGTVVPEITRQPASKALYAGRTARFNVECLGTSLSYQWRRNGADLANGANISGAQTDALVISNVGSGDAASYTVVITNSAGAVTSSPPATLTLVQPSGAPYENAVLSANPLAYWRLNENNNPASGTATAQDSWGGYAGVYGVACSNKFNGILGPLAADGFTIFEPGNGAMQSAADTDKSWVTLPPLNLNTNQATLTGWIYPIGPQADWSGLIYTRQSGVGAGLSYGGAYSGTAGQLSYSWNNNSETTWGWFSFLYIPSDQWSFIALVVEPAQAVLYVYNTSGQASATNAIEHLVEPWPGEVILGGDPNNSISRTFNGRIDEVAVFNRALTPAEILDLYNGVGPVTLSVQRSGANIVLSWPQGTLLEATSVTGGWVTNNATSPYTNTPTGAQKFYRARVQ